MDSVLRSTSGNIAASRSSFTALSAICSADLQQAPAAALRPAASRSAPDGAEPDRSPTSTQDAELDQISGNGRTPTRAAAAVGSNAQ